MSDDVNTFILGEIELATTDDKLYTVINQQAVSNIELALINKNLADLNTLIRGDGKGFDGLLIEIDRLKQAEKKRDENSERTFWVAISTAIALAVKFIWDFFVRK